MIFAVTAYDTVSVNEGLVSHCHYIPNCYNLNNNSIKAQQFVSEHKFNYFHYLVKFVQHLFLSLTISCQYVYTHMSLICL